ncbi:hypothetical protein PR048_023298 [Dryococelus australis]|uniref:Uncharacterized protein n=1 Tax=Dryococelus australis TaxID=614101 RepID=A0ABQ9GTS8_9NEOP|nr:hypothetical protein PR048_023298 [Dryococelus australis]
MVGGHLCCKTPADVDSRGAAAGDDRRRAADVLSLPSPSSVQSNNGRLFASVAPGDCLPLCCARVLPDWLELLANLRLLSSLLAVLFDPSLAASLHVGWTVVNLLASHQGELGSISGRITPDFRMRESWRNMPLVGGFSLGSPVPPPPIPALLHSHPASPSSALKTTHPPCMEVIKPTCIIGLLACLSGPLVNIHPTTMGKGGGREESDRASWGHQTSTQPTKKHLICTGKRKSASTARRYSALRVGATRRWPRALLSPVSLCLEYGRKSWGHVLSHGSSAALQIQRPALRGDGALVARARVTLVAPALHGQEIRRRQVAALTDADWRTASRRAPTRGAFLLKCAAGVHCKSGCLNSVLVAFTIRCTVQVLRDIVENLVWPVYRASRSYAVCTSAGVEDLLRYERLASAIPHAQHALSVRGVSFRKREGAKKSFNAAITGSSFLADTDHVTRRIGDFLGKVLPPRTRRTRAATW